MKLRELSFTDEAECAADIKRLAQGCRAGGNWSLEQACWHINFPLIPSLRDAGSDQPTAEQLKMQGLIDQVIASGWPSGLPAPQVMVPPPHAEPKAVDDLLDSLNRLASENVSRVNAMVFGPVEIEKFRRFVLIHAAHHLSHFEPN